MPGRGEEDDISYAVGKIEGKLDDILRRLAHADTSRTRMHERLNAVQADLAAMNVTVGGVRRDLDQMKPAIAEVPAIKEDVDAMKPEVAMVRRVKQQAGGAILVLGSIGAILGFIVATFLVDPIKGAVWRMFH